MKRTAKMPMVQAQLQSDERYYAESFSMDIGEIDQWLYQSLKVKLWYQFPN